MFTGNMFQFRLQPERRVLMSDVRLAPSAADTTHVPIKEGDDIEVSAACFMHDSIKISLKYTVFIVSFIGRHY